MTLIKQTNTTFGNPRGGFICFILCNTILSSKVCFDRMTLGLLFVSLKALWRLAGLSFTLRFKILPKKKKLSNQKSRCARTRHCYAMPILLCFSGVFLHCKNVFISHIWEVNNCTAWVKPVLKLQWNSLNFIKTLWRKTAEIKETQNVVSSLQDVYTTSLDFS